MNLTKTPVYLQQRRQCRQAILDFLNLHSDRQWRAGEIHKQAASEFNFSNLIANLDDLADTGAIRRYCSGYRHTYQAKTDESNRPSP